MSWLPTVITTIEAWIERFVADAKRTTCSATDASNGEPGQPALVELTTSAAAVDDVDRASDDRKRGGGENPGQNAVAIHRLSGGCPSFPVGDPLSAAMMPLRLRFGIGMSTEQHIQQRIRLACGNGSVRLWRNNVGRLLDQRGQMVTFGLCPGSSDLIGLRSVVITPEMVGQRVAVFCAIEVKSERGRVRAEQEAFLNHIKAMGGRAGIARSISDAEGILNGSALN